MKNERLLNIIGQVDEKYILEAAPGKQKKRKKAVWIQWGAMAACACLIFFVGGRILLMRGSDASSSDMSAEVNGNSYGVAESAKQEAADSALEGGVPAEGAPEAELSSSAASITEAEAASSEAAVVVPEEAVTEVNWGVALYAENITPTGLTLVCTQSGGEPAGELQTGCDYKLMVLENGNWEYVPYIVEEIAWTTEAYLIPMEGSMEWELNWERIYGQLPAGRYRLVKNIMDFRDAGDYDTADFYVEFTIED